MERHEFELVLQNQKLAASTPAAPSARPAQANSSPALLRAISSCMSHTPRIGGAIFSQATRFPEGRPEWGNARVRWLSAAE